LNYELNRCALAGSWQRNRAGDKKILDLVLAIAAMATKGANSGEFSSICPTSHRLRIHPEKGGHFGGSHKNLGIRHREKPTFQEKINSLIQYPKSDISEPESTI
jgi:hypothetical protein